jgi:heme-degrading monooxygenase HmoA
MSANKIIEIVAAQSDTPEKDTDFDGWYTGHHVPILLGYKGLKAASRYKLIGDDKNVSRYLTFYEFESKEAAENFKKSPQFAAAIKDFEQNKERVGFELKWAASYELIKSWGR